jgi:hypothetical protein
MSVEILDKSRESEEVTVLKGEAIEMEFFLEELSTN